MALSKAMRTEIQQLQDQYEYLEYTLNKIKKWEMGNPPSNALTMRLTIWEDQITMAGALLSHMNDMESEYDDPRGLLKMRKGMKKVLK